MSDTPKHPQARLYPSDVVTLSLLFVLKGSSERAFYRWLERDDRPLFPRLPERTRLFRLFATHQDWATRFLAEPTIVGVADSYGVELTHPYREQRRRRLARIGRKGVSNHRWIVGGTLGVVLNKWGLVCAWGADTANAHDRTFHPLVTRFAERMIVFADTTFGRKEGNPSNLKVCARHLERPYARGDHLLHAHTGLPHQKSRPSRLAVLHHAPGLHRGPVQHPCPMGWPPARRAGARSSLYRPVQLVTLCH